MKLCFPSHVLIRVFFLKDFCCCLYVNKMVFLGVDRLSFCVENRAFRTGTLYYSKHAISNAEATKRLEIACTSITSAREIAV